MFIELYNQKKELSRFERPSWMKNPSKVNYEDIKDLTDSELESVVSKFNETETSNNEASRHNRELFEEAKKIYIKDLQDIGIVVYGTRGGLLQIFANTLREINYKMAGISVPAKPNPNMFYKDKEIRMGGNLSSKLIQLKKYGEREERLEMQHNEMFAKAVLYQEEHQLVVSYIHSFNPQELIDFVNEHAREEYTLKNFPDGTPMDVDQCDECGEWTVGERRCDCGNRRVYLEVEGDFLTGFYGRAEAY